MTHRDRFPVSREVINHAESFQRGMDLIEMDAAEYRAMQVKRERERCSCPYCEAGYPSRPLNASAINASKEAYDQDMADAAAGKPLIPALARQAGEPSGKSLLMMKMLASLPHDTFVTDQSRRTYETEVSPYGATVWPVRRPEDYSPSELEIDPSYSWDYVPMPPRDKAAEQRVADMVKDDVQHQIDWAQRDQRKSISTSTTTKPIEEQMQELMDNPPSALTNLDARKLLNDLKSSVAKSLESYLFEPNK